MIRESKGEEYLHLADRDSRCQGMRVCLCVWLRNFDFVSTTFIDVEKDKSLTLISGTSNILAPVQQLRLRRGWWEVYRALVIRAPSMIASSRLCIITRSANRHNMCRNNSFIGMPNVLCSQADGFTSSEGIFQEIQLKSAG